MPSWKKVLVSGSSAHLNHITASGNSTFGGDVGIGTASPSSKLEIAFSRATTLPTTYDVTHANASAPLSDGELVIKNTANNEVGSFASLFFYAGQQSSTEALAGVGKITLRKSSAATYVSEMGFWTRKSDGDLNQNMVIDTNGNVGIGTASPASNLHVETGAVRQILAVRGGPGEIAAFTESQGAIDSGHDTYILVGGYRHTNNAINISPLQLGYRNDSTRVGYLKLNGGTDAIVLDASGNTTFGGNISGSASSTGSFGVYGNNFIPSMHNTHDLGSLTHRWANVYSADLHLSNEDTEGNEVDGTTGNWTLQEGENDIFIINRNTGKKFKIKLEPVGEE